MDQFSKVLLAIDNEHRVPEGLRQQTRLMYIKPDIWAQPSHSLWLEYMW